MVQPSAHAFGFDAGVLQSGEYLVCEFWGAGVGVLDFVVVGWEAVVVVYQTLGRCGVDFDGIAIALPVGAEHDDGFGLYFVRDFMTDGLEFGVGWVGVVFKEVGATCVGVSDVVRL